MSFCIRCKTILTDTNWRSYARLHNNHICKFCHKFMIDKWWQTHQEHEYALRDLYTQNHKEEIAYYKHKLCQERKLKVLLHYSYGTLKCANPFLIHLIPFTDVRALSIDHINGNGRAHTKEIGKANLYFWLIKNSYPEGYQVLCMNCQYLKRLINKQEQGNAISIDSKYLTRTRHYHILQHYSNKIAFCLKCGLTDPRLLTINHIYGAGKRHTTMIHMSLSHWIVKNHYPTGFDVLCWNCQFITEQERIKLRYIKQEEALTSISPLKGAVIA